MHDLKIRRAAVLGAGVMGAAIAAHLANAGIPTLLLDMKTDGDPRSANKLAAAGLTRASKAKPASFFTRAAVSLVSVGNFTDDLGKLADVDWVIEAVIENLDIKRSLYEKIAPHLGPHAVISSNTSGLSVGALSDALPASLRSRFLVTHFFNPPRYLKLLELVPGPETDGAVMTAMRTFGEERLGKGVVPAKDTPNFIGNRVGVFSLMHGVRHMTEFGLTVSDVDAVTGPLIGRPKSATFRTADVVGLDTLMYVSDGLADRLPDDPERDNLRPPAFVKKLVESQRLGEKTGVGFYKKTKIDGKRAILMLDPATDDYVPTNKPMFASLGAARAEPTAAGRVRAVLGGDDAAATFLWANLSATMRYAATCVPEISDDIAAVDDAMRWGFGWELGPFELWDAIGVSAVIERMEAEGIAVPDLARRVANTAAGSFYHEGTVFDPASGDHVARETDDRRLTIASRRGAGRVVSENESAALIDLGDDVLAFCLETKMNTIDMGVIDSLNAAIDRVEREGRGLVIGTDANDFSAGANLALILEGIKGGEVGRVEENVRAFQAVNQRTRFCARPVVAAVRGLTIGGGCEVVLGTDHVVAAAETYIGLVELGAGVIPAGGGCKELIKRADERIPAGMAMDPFPFVRWIFETVGMARVATSASEGAELGFLRPTDRIVMNSDHLLHHAKNAVVAIDTAGYRPSLPRTDIRVMGRPGLATLESALYNMSSAAYISPYDQVLGRELAWILTGGDLSGPASVSEEYLLELEIQAFMRLCGDERTHARMAHILETGKPLRN